MQSFWDTRYDTDVYVYGTDPNRFFAEVMQPLNPGRLLLPGEGEGRNAVFAATLGWQVDAMDQSPVAAAKALDLAEKAGVHIHYHVGDISEFTSAPETYDAVGLIFLHLAPSVRPTFHEKMVQDLKHGGMLILEAFHRDQIELSTGGPRNPEMLFTPEMLSEDFRALDLRTLEVASVDLKEGRFHQGTARVVRLIGIKR